MSMLYCQGVVNRIQMTDAQLSELVGKLREAEDAAGLTRGLAGDLCSISHEFRLGFEPALSEDFLERTKERIWHWAWLASGLCDLNHLEYLRLMRDAVKISGGPSVPSMLEEMEALQNRADGLPFMYRGARSFVPALAGCARRHAGSLAQLRTARGALAVERYRIANGRLPEKLDDLVPEFMGAIPVDPFDGRPLRYKKLEKGYVVYSVGTDRADDGGKEGDGLEEGSDITFIVER
ncbi:MAG: hypothetical protein QGH74_09195 [Candidatus Brocadiia bacterium]|nr:hypothetical protein [Candidatus Brocadiia bacterium]